MPRKDKLGGSEVILASSILYYDQEELSKFLNIFQDMNTSGDFAVDGCFLSFVKFVGQWLGKHEFDDFENPEARRNSMVQSVLIANELEPNVKVREAFDVWFDKVQDTDVPMELAEDAVGRFLWDNIKQQVELLDKSGMPFVDRVLQMPNMPQSVRSEQVLKLSDIAKSEMDEDNVWFTTSIPDFDQYVKLKPSNFVVIAARPGVGKSLMMQKIALANANRGVTCMYLSLEMNRKQLKARFASYFSEDDIEARFTDAQGFLDAKAYNKAVLDIMTGKSFKKIDDHLLMYVSRRTDATAILADIEQQIKREHVKIVLLDYLQLLSYAGMDEWASLRKLTKDLKSIALRYNVVMVTASQVSRTSTERGLYLSDLFGSQSIEADTDIVVGLEECQSRERNTPQSIINIKAMKNRDGERMDLKRCIDYSTGRIYETAYM